MPTAARRGSGATTIRIDHEKAAPGAVEALSGVHAHVARSGLDPVLVELAYLRVSPIDGCADGLDLHARGLARKGVPPEKLALVQAWRHAGPVFDARERAALAWAEGVTRVAETAVPERIPPRRRPPSASGRSST